MAKSNSPRELIVPDDKVLADPTKTFFVTMLTRDIALIDAIMDLVDNCIDGVHRQLKKSGKGKNVQYLYKGFHAEISINSSEFSLKDNCGGIPVDIAKHYAFRMGRSEDYHFDDNLETLGMYGIGMKRAIFKIGLQADVTTWHKDDIFKVHIPENWSKMPGWWFDFKALRKTEIKTVLKEPGTRVHITKLHATIKKQFEDKSGFLKDLMIVLRNHYGYIIQQGFKITLNGSKVPPIELSILTSDSEVSKAIKPYVYKSAFSGVDVEIMIGFYRPFASEDEIEKELNGGYAESISENAGITVLCNDRVVLHSDKSFLTGWGEPPVPKYHTQFIAIAGVVHFRSKIPLSLPVTTTKRGLDTSSSVYANAKIRIKEGLKLFTSFTNTWKAPSEERAKLFKSTKAINALKPGQSKSPLVRLIKKRGEQGEYQIPTLPRPNDNKRNGLISISFQREKEKVERVRQTFLDEGSSPSDVGGWCFDKIYSQVK